MPSIVERLILRAAQRLFAKRTMDQELNQRMHFLQQRNLVGTDSIAPALTDDDFAPTRREACRHF
jgi:hypothetical protein